MPARKANDRLAGLVSAKKVNIAKEILGIKGQIFPSLTELDTKIDGKDYLKQLGELVAENYELDKGSRTQWEENLARDLELFSSYMPPKSDPWEGCSNVNMPFITIAIIQFQARAIEAIIPPKDIVQCLNTGDEDLTRAERVAKYMNYQLLYKMDNFVEGMDKSMIQLPVAGTIFRKTWWDPLKKKVRSEYVNAAYVVTNYGNHHLDSDTRISHIIPMSVSKIRKRVKKGIFIKEAWDLNNSTETLNSDRLRETMDAVFGESNTETQEKTPKRVLVEQHVMVDIDDDGIDEHLIVTIDLETRMVLRITSRTYMEDKEEKELQYFTDYHFIPSPEGFYSYGLASLLRSLNEAANTIVNEVIDAGNIANKQGGFIAKRGGTQRGDMELEHGVFKQVDMFTDDLRKHIMPFSFQGPNNTLYSVLGLLYEYAKLVSSVSETTTGTLPASDTPAATVLALIEEGRKVYSSIHKRIHRAFKRELDKIRHLNSLFLDEEIYFRVLGDQNLPTGEGEIVGRSDFAGKIDVVPVSDSNITSTSEKLVKAKEVMDVVAQHPVTANNPDTQRSALKRYLDLLGIENVDTLLGPPPEPEDVPAVEENADFLKEVNNPALPQQDHMEHITVHNALKKGAYFAQLTPHGKQLLDAHIQEHVAFQYVIDNQELMPQEAANVQ